MSIKPGLIIHRSERYHLVQQICKKYAIVPNKIDYFELQAQRRTKALSFRHFKKATSKVSHQISTKTKGLQNKRFAQRISDFRVLQKLDLTLNFKYMSTQNYQELNLFLRSIFKRNKRLTHVNLTLNNQIEGIKLLKKSLSLASYLKALNLSAIPYTEAGINAFQKIFTLGSLRRSWSLLEKITFDFGYRTYLPFEITLELQKKFKDLLSFLVDSFYCNSKKNFKIAYPLYIDSNDSSLKTLIKQSLSFPCLSNLTFHSNNRSDTLLLMELIPNNSHLQQLTLNLFTNQTSKLLPGLSQTFYKLSSLKELTINIAKEPVEQPQGIITHFEGLQTLTQLTAFKLTVDDAQCLDRNFFLLLAGTLKRFSSLKRLHLGFSLQVNAQGFDKQVSAGMQKLVQVIGLLGNLQDLALWFRCYKAFVSDSLVKDICTSVKGLNFLTSFELFLPAADITPKVLYFLSEALENLERLENLALNFQNNKILNPQVVSILYEKLGQLQQLTGLRFYFSCEMSTDVFNMELVELVLQLKKLSRLGLDLMVQNGSIDHKERRRITKIFDSLKHKFASTILTKRLP